jgi:pimeloyl-ACP methyl ester carboxylesterase
MQKLQSTKLLAILLLLTGISILFSCKKENTDSNKISPTPSPTPTFIVNNKEEQMPVWVEGKADATYIVLAVSGGPGSDVLDFRNYHNGTGFKEIEKNYLVAYWQQRTAGESVGPDNKAYYTIAQYVEDCDKVIDELKSRYADKKIVLLGHSWGGMLTSSYLADATRRSKIVAWIDAAGVTNGTTWPQQTIDDVNAEADKRIANNENTTYWINLKNDLKAYPFYANYLAYSCIEKVAEVPVKVNNGEFIFSNRVSTSHPILIGELSKTNNTAQLPAFTLPTLLLWGKYDFVVSKKQRDEVISKIGTAKLTNVELDASGHYMMFHEPLKFATSIIDFIKTL